MGAKITYRHNVMSVDSIDAFLNIRGGFNNSLRDVYFVRGVGEPSNLVDIIDDVDKRMGIEMSKNRLQYVRIDSLPQLRSVEDSEFYSATYDKWINGEGIQLRNVRIQGGFGEVVKDSCRWVIEKYVAFKKNASDSMLRNFATKLLFWFDNAVGDMFSTWNERSCIKVIADNVVKDQEYLFYLFLTRMGCDVLLIENRSDIELTEELKQYSHELKLGEFGGATLKKYTPYIPQKDEVKQASSSAVQEAGGSTSQSVKVTIPKRPERHTSVANAEKTFEELAQLASSIVLIAIHDANGEVIGTGSGIMIGRDGYILTNNHVACGGKFYTVRIEDDEEVYATDEVIKYNSTTDLAIIRIRRQLVPLPIYRGNKKLVRGQKVVAIGSPLGLFNSVSDGIISGFRNINDVDMIQFTAPISHGSSGGAVLNMQGEVIGISTAGIDSGQNINLAIGYESILMFAGNFMS